jgi:hypothetical protein
MELVTAATLKQAPVLLASWIEPLTRKVLILFCCVSVLYQLLPVPCVMAALAACSAVAACCVWVYVQTQSDVVTVTKRGANELEITCRSSNSTLTSTVMLFLFLYHTGLTQPAARAYMQYALLRMAPLRLRWPQRGAARQSPCVFINHHLYTDILTRRGQRSCSGEACNYGHHRGWDKFFGGQFATTCMLDIYVGFMHMRDTYTIMQASDIGFGYMVKRGLNQALVSLGCKPRAFQSVENVDKKLWGAVEVPRRTTKASASSSDIWWRTAQVIQMRLAQNSSYAFVMYPRGNVLKTWCSHEGDTRKGWAWNFAQGEAQNWEANGAVRPGYPAQDCLSFYASSPVVVAVSFGMEILIPLTVSRHGHIAIEMVDIQPRYTGGSDASTILQKEGPVDPVEAMRQWQWPAKFCGTGQSDFEQYRDRVRSECQTASRLLYAIVRQFYDAAAESL